MLSQYLVIGIQNSYEKPKMWLWYQFDDAVKMLNIIKNCTLIFQLKWIIFIYGFQVSACWRVDRCPVRTSWTLWWRTRWMWCLEDWRFGQWVTAWSTAQTRHQILSVPSALTSFRPTYTMNIQPRNCPNSSSRRLSLQRHQPLCQASLLHLSQSILFYGTKFSVSTW